MTRQHGTHGTDSEPTPPPESYDSRATGRLSSLRIDPRESSSSVESKHKTYWFIAGYLLVALVVMLCSMWAIRTWVSPSIQFYVELIVGALLVVSSAAVFFALNVRHHRQLEGIEQKLRSRDTHVGRIIDTMANGMALIDLDGTIVDVNPALASMVGYDHDDLIGRSLAPVQSSSGDRVTPTSMILEYARQNGRWTGELQRRHADGHNVPVHLTLAPLYGKQGTLAGYVGDYLDLRDIKAAEAHLDGLGGVIEQLATETDVEVVGQKAVRAAVELTGVQMGGVVVLGDEHARLEHRWLHGFSDKIQTPRPAEGAELVARIIEDPSPRKSRDFSSTPARMKLYESMDVLSLAAVPLDVRGVTRGALVVATHTDHHDFDNRQIPLLEAVARQLGVAIHRHELLQDARRSEARFRNVVNSVPDILYSASLPDFSTEFISPSVQRILGIDSEQFLANPTLWREQIHEDDIDEVNAKLDDCIESSDHYAIEYRTWNRDRSEWYWVEDRGRIRRDDQGEPSAITGVISDITARKEAQDRLTYLAFHDGLTGLPNRIGLLEQLEQFFDSQASIPGVLLYCDLDRFHLVNDIHGHESGNALLVETARRLEAVIPEDSILSRMGADEFVAFIPLPAKHQSPSSGDDDSVSKSLLEQHARDYALEMMASFQEPFTIRDQPSYLSTTIGIGLSTPDIDEPQTLLKNAHRALAHAKETGPANFAFYAGELARRQQRRLSLQSRLHRGLNNEEFELHYQPVIDLESGKITGAEALLRWTTEDGETISPGEFIPVAEESGLIIPLGDWVVHQACDDLREWIDDGLDLRIALNLSPRQFYHLDIVDRVESAVHDVGLEPSHFELELTESDMLVDPDETTQILGRLRKAGFSIAIDDFGTGYSSLERLKTLPVETLKIDRSFVSELSTGSSDISIVDTVVTLSNNFGMTSLAEGIETRQQWELVRDMGCSFGQGYFFSRPIPADEFRQLCEATPHWLSLPTTTTG